MTELRRLPAARWLLPILALIVFVGGGSAVAAIAAAGHRAPAPPPVDRLLADVAQAHVNGLSGTVVQDSNLGLPELPGMGSDTNSSSLQSLISGSHTLRVWYDGPRHVRLAVLGQMGESDIIRNGQDLWVWSSSSKTASHRVLPDHAGPAGAPSAGEHARGPMREMTPQGAARMLLSKVDPTTKVTTGPNTTVASRPAWQLLITPRSSATLVGSVRIAIDTATHLPLRVQVFPRGAGKPAFDVGYTSFDPTAPSSSVFRFNPPAGTKVTQQTGPLFGGLLAPGLRPGMHSDLGPGTGHAMKPGTLQRLHAHPMMPTAGQAPRVVGSGWDTVVVTRAPADMSGQDGQGGQLGAILKTLPQVHGSWGSGRLLQGSLFSVLLTDSGQVAAGAVPPSALYSALEAR